MSPSTPFLSGLLSLTEADEEVALIPSAITFLTAINGAKTDIQRAAAIEQLIGNLGSAEAAVPVTLQGQVIPVATAALQALLAKASATAAAGLQT